jgi:hypothetical protein
MLGSHSSEYDVVFVGHDIMQCFILVYKLGVCDRKFSALKCKMLLSFCKYIYIYVFSTVHHSIELFH